MYQQYRPSGFSLLPTVVKNLLIINGLCFLAYIAFADRGWFDLNEKLGLYYPGSSYFRPYQFITHVFMHGSFTHLLFNMFSLWMFGSVLENLWGPKRFFIYYFVTALGAGLLHIGVTAFEVHQISETVQAYVLQPGYDSFVHLMGSDPSLGNDDKIAEFIQQWSANKNSEEFINGSKQLAEVLVKRRMNEPVVGASGAVFGLLLGYGMLFPNSKLFVFPIPFPIAAKYFVIFYGLLELYSGIANNPGDNVAHFAHLGGMLFGFILIKIWNKTNRQQFY